MLLLEQGRERGEQLGTQREQDSFIGTPASLNIKTWGKQREVRRAGLIPNLLHPFSAVAAAGLFLYLCPYTSRRPSATGMSF